MASLKDFAGPENRVGIFSGRLQMLRKSLYSDTAVGSLRSVYAIALSALRHTHVLTDTIERNLAHAVFDVYLSVDCPTFPLSPEAVEELAVAAIEVMIESHGEPIFRVKH